MNNQGMMDLKPRTRSLIIALAIGVVLSLCYLNFFVFRAYMEIEIQTYNSETNHLKVYWGEESPVYTEENSRRAKINPRFVQHHFFLPDLDDIDHFRIDPIEDPAMVKIKRITISQPGYEPINLKTESDFQQLQILQHVSKSHYEQDGLMLTVDGPDSQLLLRVDHSKATAIPFTYLFNVVLIFVFSLGLTVVFQLAKARAFKSLVFVPVCLLVVLIFAIVMASITSFNVHPDEKAHFRALNYYSGHFLPPSLDEPELARTFSDYGRSRLGSYEAYYQVSGYFVRLLEPLRLSNLLSARLFGILLLLVLVLLAFRYPAYRCFTLPLLITPQAWYLFSYANSDGFSLFITILMSYQVAVKSSLLNRFVRESAPTGFWWKSLVLGTLFGVLLLLKENYYTFVLFLVGYLWWRIAMGDFPEKKRLWIRLALLIGIGLSVYGIRMGWDFVVNGPDPAQTRGALAEKYALEMYKPSTPLAQKHFYLYLKDRGVPLERLLRSDGWGEKTFGSSFGTYGYTQYTGSKTYYDLVSLIGWALMFTMLFSILINGPPALHGLFAITTGGVILLVVVTLLASWIQVFQAQGRYFAPALPMMGILYFHVREYVFERIFYCLVLVLFLFSAWSFLFVGLKSIEKTIWLLG